VSPKGPFIDLSAVADKPDSWGFTASSPSIGNGSDFGLLATVPASKTCGIKASRSGNGGQGFALREPRRPWSRSQPAESRRLNSLWHWAISRNEIAQMQIASFDIALAALFIAREQFFIRDGHFSIPRKPRAIFAIILETAQWPVLDFVAVATNRDFNKKIFVANNGLFPLCSE
jgi:hypothetical protein